MICWLPGLVRGVTELPEAADEVTAGVDPAAAPLSTAKISNDGAADGAGVHWKAQPMSQVPPAMVNAGLVQLPVCSTSGTSTVAGPTATVVVDEPAAAAAAAPAAVVDVEVGAVVAVVAPPAFAGAVVVADPDAGGNL
jgi:hypothetical protein